MSELSGESRALLRQARDDFEPSDAERSRVGRALEGRIGVAVATIATTSTAASANLAKAASLTSGAGAAGGVSAVATVKASMFVVGSKYIGAAALLASVGAGGVVMTRMRNHDVAPPKSPASEVAVGTTSRATEPRAATSSRAEMISDPAPTPSIPAPASSPRPMIGAEQASQPRFRTTVAAVADETRLVQQADDAVRRGDAARALVLLDRHAQRFPDGVLAEERSAERVMTLCKLGRVLEARKEADHFLSRTPESPLADSVRDSCAFSRGRNDDGDR